MKATSILSEGMRGLLRRRAHRQGRHSYVIQNKDESNLYGVPIGHITLLIDHTNILVMSGHLRHLWYTFLAKISTKIDQNFSYLPFFQGLFTLGFILDLNLDCHPHS
jgi:folate-dependent phosphoribosylglycinamide formyltransferase PurN